MTLFCKYFEILICLPYPQLTDTFWWTNRESQELGDKKQKILGVLPGRRGRQQACRTQPLTTKWPNRWARTQFETIHWLPSTFVDKYETWHLFVVQRLIFQNEKIFPLWFSSIKIQILFYEMYSKLIKNVFGLCLLLHF